MELGSPLKPNLTGFNNISALFSLAPTDQYKMEHLGRSLPSSSPPTSALVAPYFVLYGSHDGDVQTGLVKGDREDPYSTSGTTPGPTVGGTGFALWDRASGEEKYMAFMKGASHNGFVTKNKIDYNAVYDSVAKVDKGHYYNPSTKAWRKGIMLAGKKAHPKDWVANESIQKTVLKGFSNAFFRCYLYQESFWKPLLGGELLHPAMTAKKATISFQYKNKPSEVQQITHQVSSAEADFSDGKAQAILKTTTNSAAPSGLSSGSSIEFHTMKKFKEPLDFFSPHGVSSLLFDLRKINVVTIYNAPQPPLSAGSLSHLSFRIAKVFNYSVDLSTDPPKEMPLKIASLNKMKIIFNNNNTLSSSINKTIPDPIRRYDRSGYIPMFAIDLIRSGIYTSA
jgi:hypothetical protein